MNIEIDGKKYNTTYFPFFRLEENEDFGVWKLRLPSGKTEEVLVLDLENPMACLNDYMGYLIREYVLEDVLEDDIALTPKAIEFKRDLEELFREE